MRRVVVATVLASAAVVPAVNANASASFHAIGVVSSVDSHRHLLTVRDSGGDKSLQGRTLRIHTTASTHVKRDGKATSLAALRPGDGVDAAGHDAGSLVATRVDATSPPRPDGPPLAVPSPCLGYYLPCAPALPPATSSGSLSITISDFTFTPPVAVVPVDTIVTVHNADPFAHTFSGNHFDSGSLATGKSFSVEFTTPGTYRFFCAIHPFMNGVLEVR